MCYQLFGRLANCCLSYHIATTNLKLIEWADALSLIEIMSLFLGVKSFSIQFSFASHLLECSADINIRQSRCYAIISRLQWFAKYFMAHRVNLFCARYIRERVMTSDESAKTHDHHQFRWVRRSLLVLKSDNFYLYSGEISCVYLAGKILVFATLDPLILHF